MGIHTSPRSTSLKLSLYESTTHRSSSDRGGVRADFIGMDLLDSEQPHQSSLEPLQIIFELCSEYWKYQ